MRRIASASVGVRTALSSLAVWVVVVAVLCAAAGPNPAEGAGPNRPAPLARYFPRDDLVAYAEFDGLDAHADLWRKTAAYRLLNETSAGAMLEDVVTKLADRAMSTAPGSPLTGKDLWAVIEHTGRSGFALGVIRKPGEPRPSFVGLVFRKGARGETRGLLDKLLAAARGPGPKPRTVDKPGGRKVNEEGGGNSQGFAWWVEGDDLAFSLASPEGAGLMIEALDGTRPDATGHPNRTALARTEDGFTPVGLAFFDAAALPSLPPQAAALGLDRLKRVEFRWGFQAEAVMTVTRVVAPGPRSGLLAVLDQPTFGRKDLAPLPPGLAGVTAFSVEPAGLYDRVAAGFAATDPATRGPFEAFEASVRDVTGHRLRDDVLAHLGPRVTYYTLPTRVDAPANVLAALLQGLVLAPRLAAVIEVKDLNAFSKVFHDVMTALRADLDARASANPGTAFVRVRPLKGVGHGYVASIPASSVPLPTGFRPTVVLGKKALILGSTPESPRAALAIEGQGGGDLPADDALSGPLGRLPGGMIFVNVSDPRRSLLPEVIADLPGLIQLAGTASSTGFRPPFLRGGPRRPMMGGPPPLRLEIDPDKVPAADDLRPFLFPSLYTFTTDDEGFQFVSREAFPVFNPVAVTPVTAVLLLPAVLASRSAALRARSVNNMKQIGLAMHNYHSVNNHFPPPAITDDEGKPLLSWRVAILPFIEQQQLYNEFKLDEPWDSENNKALIKRMPEIFAIPSTKAEPGKTFYRGFSGEQTLFDPEVKEGTGIATVTDGTSNTVGVVEAKTAVIWTKPGEELPFDPAKNPAKLVELLGGHFPGGFNALFLDGSVKFLKTSINPNVLRALITRNGGEVISADSF